MQRRRGTTRQPLETSWGNQPQGQDLPRFPSPKAITQANWSEGDTPFLEKGWQGRRFPVIASPIVGDELKKEDNTHHAHIELCDELDATFNAFYLRELFTRKRKCGEHRAI